MTTDSHERASDSAERSALEARLAYLARHVGAARQRIERLERQFSSL